MYKISLLSVFAIMLSGCGLVEVEEEAPPAEEVATSSKAAEPVQRETKNVTYQGKVVAGGMSIYQEGSHRLIIDGEKFILLESNTVDLNGYVGEQVTIKGALRPTVEAGGTIMRVQEISLNESEDDKELDEIIDDAPEAPEAEEVEEEEQPEEVSEAKEEPIEEPTPEPSEGETEEKPVVEEEETVVETETEEPEEVEEASEEEVSEPSSYATPPAERIAAMAGQDFSAENWSQQYCTSHIGFCIPVHRNWWFKSFGATSSVLWHVELSSEPIENLGDGPIRIDLVAGSNSDADGTVSIEGSEVFGIKEWTFGRHFRVSAESSLQEAVQYIVDNFSEYE